eukprot:4864521-Amphidinium_carterae.1
MHGMYIQERAQSNYNKSSYQPHGPSRPRMLAIRVEFRFGRDLWCFFIERTLSGRARSLSSQFELQGASHDAEHAIHQHKVQLGCLGQIPVWREAYKLQNCGVNKVCVLFVVTRHSLCSSACSRAAEDISPLSLSLNMGKNAKHARTRSIGTKAPLTARISSTMSCHVGT